MSSGFFLSSYPEMSDNFLRKIAVRVAKTIEISLDEDSIKCIFELAHFDEKFEDVVLRVCEKNGIEFPKAYKYVFLLHVRGELDFIKKARDFEETVLMSEDIEMEVVEDKYHEHQPENMTEYFIVENLQEHPDYETDLRASNVAEIIASSLNEKEQDYIFKLVYTDSRFFEAVSIVCERHGIKFETNEKLTFLLCVRYELDILKLVRDMQKQESYVRDDVQEITASSPGLDILDEVGQDIEFRENYFSPESDYSPETLAELLHIERDLYASDVRRLSCF